MTFHSYYSVLFSILHWQTITADSFFLAFANAVFSHWYSSKQFSYPPLCFPLWLFFFLSLWTTAFLALLSRLLSTFSSTLTIQWLLTHLLPIPTSWSFFAIVIREKKKSYHHTRKRFYLVTPVWQDFSWLIYCQS